LTDSSQVTVHTMSKNGRFLLFSEFLRIMTSKWKLYDV